MFEALLGGSLLPAPFTFSPIAPCSLAFFHACSLIIFSLLPFHFSLLPAPFYFSKCSLIFLHGLPMKMIVKHSTLSLPRSSADLREQARLEI